MFKIAPSGFSRKTKQISVFHALRIRIRFISDFESDPIKNHLKIIEKNNTLQELTFFLP